MGGDRQCSRQWSEPGNAEDERVIAKGGDVEKQEFRVQGARRRDGDSDGHGVMSNRTGRNRATVDDNKFPRGLLQKEWKTVGGDKVAIDEIGRRAGIKHGMGRNRLLADLESNIDDKVIVDRENGVVRREGIRVV